VSSRKILILSEKFLNSEQQYFHILQSDKKTGNRENPYFPQKMLRQGLFP